MSHRLASRSFVSLLLLLAGCATSSLYGDPRTDGICHERYIDEKRLSKELSEASSCCTDLGVIPYEVVVVTKETQFILQKASPVYDFPSGRSRLAAFTLAPDASGYLVVTPGTSGGRTSIAESCQDFKTSVIVGGGSERYRAIEPIVTFLGSDRKVIAAGVPAISHDTGDYRIPIPPGAKFAIVHTDPKRHGRERRLFVTPTSTPLVVPGTPGAIMITGPSSVASITTATGLFVVTYSK
jgi:hypothetical protein